MRRLYKAVKETREQIAGCMDPNVSLLCCFAVPTINDPLMQYVL